MSKQHVIRLGIVLAGGAVCALAIYRSYSVPRARDTRLRQQVIAALDQYEFTEASRLLDESAWVSAETEFLQAQLARRRHPADFETARYHLDNAVRRGVDRERGEREQALLACQQRGPTPSLRGQLLDAMHERPEQALDVYETLVRGCLLIGRVNEALALLDQWASEHPHDWRAHLWRGAAFEHLGLAALSVREYQIVLESRPGFSLVRRRLGLVLAQTGYDFEAALECLETLDASDDADVLVAEALCRRALGEIDEAKRLTERALAIDGSHHRGLQLGALLKLQAGDNEAALEFTEQLAASKSRSDPEEAVRRLLELRPVAFQVYDTQATGEALYLRATALQRLGRQSEAQALMRELRDLQDTAAEIKWLLRDEDSTSTDPATWRRLGQLYAEIGFDDHARMWWSRVLEVDSGDVSARNALRRLNGRETDLAAP